MGMNCKVCGYLLKDCVCMCKMDIKKNSYATEEEVDKFFDNQASLNDINFSDMENRIVAMSKEIIDANFDFIRDGKTITDRTPSEPELQNIKPRDHAKPFFTTPIMEWGSEWEHIGTVIGRMRSNQPSFQCIAKDHPKLTFLKVIEDGKRLEVWKDDFKMISQINVGKHCIDEVIKNKNQFIFNVLTKISITKSKGDLR